MMTPEQRLADLGLSLPAPTKTPAGLHLPFVPKNERGDRVFVSGHPKTSQLGAIIGPYGQAGRDLTTQEAQSAARDIGLTVLANLKQEIGELSRVTGWSRVFGMVNSAPDYTEQHLVINGFSDLILQVFGPEIGRHARSAIGTHGLPLNFALEIECELQIENG
jgi:enamine deaminase RidA (YjgF/YER057c/UK114 family)